jgi:hypothetical protein
MADNWAAFDAPSAGPAAVQAAPAPVADPWAAFDAPASPAVVSRPGAPTPTAAVGRGVMPGVTPSFVPQLGGKISGMDANTLAGVEEGGAGLVNVLADPVGNLVARPALALGMGAYNLGARALGYDKLSPEQQDAVQRSYSHGIGNSVTSEVARQTGGEEATPGSNAVNAGARALGLPVAGDIVSATPEEKYMRAMTSGAVSNLPFGGAGLVRGLVTGAVSGAGSQFLSDAAPDDLKPAAGIVGGIVAPAAPGIARAVGGTMARPVVNALSDAVGPTFGRVNPLMSEAGVPFLTPTDKPITANAAQVRLAGKQAVGLMSDPDAVRARLADLPEPAIPGAPMSTFQATGDYKLGNAERQDSRNGPNVDDWRKLQDQRNDAQVGVLKGIAPDSDPAAIQQSLQRRAADVDAEESARVARVQQQAAADHQAEQAALEAQRAAAQQAADAKIQQAQSLVEAHRQRAVDQARQAAGAIGGDYPAGSEANVGAAARDPVMAAAAADRVARGKLYDAIDPEGKLNVGIGPLKDAHADLARQTTPFSTGSDAETRITGALQSLPDVVPFKYLRDLKTQLTEEMRAARSAGKLDDHRRLNILLDGVHNAMSDAANATDLPGVTGSASASSAEASGAGAGDHVPSTGSAVFAPGGQRVDVRYGVREADELTPSNLADGRINPAYNQDLQPRDRTRTASQQQIQRIRTGLRPEEVSASPSTALGAPLHGPDGQIESGNGRYWGIRQALEDGGDAAQRYRDHLTSQGYDISGMKLPMLTRERLTPIAEADRPAWARAAGENPVMDMSPSEQAAADAKQIPPDSLNLYRGGDVNDARNRDFVRAFAQHVVPESEHASFMTGDGALSVGGANRVTNALSQHAYGSNALVSALAEQADPNIRAFGGAMSDAAGPMAKLRSAIDSGNVSASSDLARPLVEAANLVQDARRRGISLSDAVAQHDAFAQRDPMVEPLLRAAYGDDYAGRMSRAKFADLLANYADEAQQQAGLFGANKAQPEMLQEAAQRYGYGAGRQEATAPGTASGTVTGAGQNGDQAFGPGSVAAGQANAGGRGASGAAGPSGTAASDGSRNRSAVPNAASQPLTANFDQAARERLRAADAKNVRDVQTYGKPAPGVGEILAPGPTKGTFKVPDAKVPDVIVRAGPMGADVAKAYLKAGGTPEGLADMAAFSLRQAAMKDGVIDPAKYADWAAKRSGFLSQIPDAAAKFGAAADASRAAQAAAERGAAALKLAQQSVGQSLKSADAAHAAALKAAAKTAQDTVNDAVANRAAAVRDAQTGAAGKLLSGDPVMRVRAVLNSATAVDDMAQLARLTENDPEGRAGLQAAVRDHILKTLQGDSKGAASEEGYLFGGQLKRFLREKDAALSQIMSPEQMRSLHSVADSLAEVRDTRIGSGSDTSQNMGGPKGVGKSFLSALAGKVVGAATGSTVGGSLGFYFAGPVGGSIGSAVGGAAGAAIQALREAGIQNVDHLVSQALINPALMRTLMTKATESNTPALMANLASQVRRLSLVSATRQAGQPEPDQRPPTRRNALLH